MILFAYEIETKPMNRYTIAIFLSLLCMASFAQQREKDDHARARDEWFYSQRAYPLGRIPPLARVNAIAEIRRIDAAARQRRQQLRTASLTDTVRGTLDAATWTSIGPKPTDGGSTYVTAGRVNAIAIDPRDNNVVYIGAAEGGVWKTTDGGANWKPLTDDQPSLASGAIALDPSNPDIVYVGTGEENFAQDNYYGAGILKSADGGNTWTQIPGPFLTGSTRATIGALAIHPSITQILLCSSNIGIYRSSDSAATWTRVLTGIGTSVVFDPSNGDIAYAAIGATGGNSANGVYRSTDAGQTWQLIPGSGANALPTANVGRIEIAIAPSTPTTIYVGIQNSSTANFGKLLGLFKTTDSGGTWNNTNAPDICSSPGQCWYDMTIRVHPRDPDIVFAFGSASSPRARSMDGGSTWQSLAAVGPNGVQIHVDNHYLALTSDGSKLYVANDGGMWSTTDVTNTPVNWTELNDTLAITQFYPGLSIHPANANIAYAGAQDNGTQRYSGNVSWNNVTCGDGGNTAIDVSLPSIAYSACQDIAIRRTTNGGNNWIVAQYGFNQQDRTQFISPLVIDPSNPQNLYFGTFRVYQTKDGAGKWIPISGDLTAGRAAIKTIGVAPSDPNTVYAGTSDSRIQVTNDALNGPNSTWTNRSVGLPPRVVTQVVVDPIDPATAYATFSGFVGTTTTPGHVFKTTDSGQNWTDLSGNLPDIPVNTIVVDPDIANALYIGTDAGVMVTTDAGATWSSLGNGMPKVVVHSLVLHRASRTLRAATHGRSVWDILVPLAATSMQPGITSLSPTTTNAGGGDFSLSATGMNFVAEAKLRWNGLTRPTNVVDSTHLVAQIAAADIANVGRVAIDVFNPTFGAGISNSMPFNIGPAPVSSTAGFVSATNVPGNSLSPRSIASLYGTNLSGIISLADSPPPLPSTLGGTTLTLAGNTLPLFFVSPQQINFQLPFITINGPTPETLTITQGQFTTSIPVTLTPFAPSFFTTNSQGTGQAAALINETSIIVAPVGMFPGSRPVKKGEFIQLYCTGLGDVTNRPGLGAPSPTNPLASTLVKPTLTVGTVPANVLFSGLSPNFVGLYQVNIQITTDMPSGPAVPVALTIGGAKSNTVTIAIE